MATAATSKTNGNGSKKAAPKAKAATRKAATRKTAKPKTNRLVRTRRARETGVIVETWQGKDGRDGWQLVCTEHGTIADFKSHTEAAPLAATPSKWCPDCKKALAAKKAAASKKQAAAAGKKTAA